MLCFPLKTLESRSKTKAAEGSSAWAELFRQCSFKKENMYTSLWSICPSESPALPSAKQISRAARFQQRRRWNCATDGISVFFLSSETVDILRDNAAIGLAQSIGSAPLGFQSDPPGKKRRRRKVFKLALFVSRIKQRLRLSCNRHNLAAKVNEQRIAPCPFSPQSMRVLSIRRALCWGLVLVT